MGGFTLFDVYFKLIGRSPIENTCKLIARNGWYWGGAVSTNRQDSVLSSANKVNLKNLDEFE